MSKKALPITVMAGGCVSFNFLPDRTRNGNCTCVQPNTIWRSSPLRFGRYLNNDDAKLVSSRIFESNVKVAVLPGGASISRFIPLFPYQKRPQATRLGFAGIWRTCYVKLLCIQPLKWLYEGSGGGEIRTHETFRPSGFQDRRNQPLCHPSKNTRSRDREFITPLLHYSK